MIHNKWNKILRKWYALQDRRQINYEAYIEDKLEFIHLPVNFNAPKRPLRILYIARKYSQGQRNRGFSHSENHFLGSLVNMGHMIFRLDYPNDQASGRLITNIMQDTVARYNPDVLFTVLAKDEIAREAIQEISTQTGTVTINYFCDDDWRFDTFTTHWAPAFNWSLTNSQAAMPKYDGINYENVIYMQWGYNHYLYKKLDLPHIYPVSFIGQAHGSRRQVINELEQKGIKVHTWGVGWKTGSITQLQMVKIINQSQINLNLSEASVPGVIEVKGRDTEIPGCGGFLLTGAPEDEISSYYNIDRDIVHYTSTTELFEKTKYYLAHDEERKEIAQTGYLHTLTRHTYEHRFNSIFRKIGLLPGEGI